MCPAKAIGEGFKRFWHCRFVAAHETRSLAQVPCKNIRECVRSRKSTGQAWYAIVRKQVVQECPSTVSYKSVQESTLQMWLGKMFYGSVYCIWVRGFLSFHKKMVYLRQTKQKPSFHVFPEQTPQKHCQNHSQDDCPDQFLYPHLRDPLPPLNSLLIPFNSGGGGS